MKRFYHFYTVGDRIKTLVRLYEGYVTIEGLYSKSHNKSHFNAKRVNAVKLYIYIAFYSLCKGSLPY